MYNHYINTIYYHYNNTTTINYNYLIIITIIILIGNAFLSWCILFFKFNTMFIKSTSTLK